MKYKIKTKRDYDFYVVLSAVQKAIRRNDIKIAGYFALELFASNFWFILWKRLLVISAEDCYGLITTEIFNLFQCFLLINDKQKDLKGRVFITKAIILLCRCPKDRDSDHLGILCYDRKVGITDSDINFYLKQIDPEKKQEIPDYAYDVHTLYGKMEGMTRNDFIKSEYFCLKPATQLSLFDKDIKFM